MNTTRSIRLAVLVLFALASGVDVAYAQQSRRPNVVYFLVDNLGMGELSSYSGGPLRGTSTPRIDALAQEGMRLLNFAPETQCTPSRSALMTGRYSIRSGNQTVALAGSHGGLVKWERTMGDIFSAAGYATAIVGKWHIGDSDGRWPTDHGFDEWYGIPRSYDESLWPGDPWYDPKRDPVTHVLEGRKGQPARELEQLTVEVRRDIDVEYMKRAKAFLKRSTDSSKPFFLYFNHSMMHLPTIPAPSSRARRATGTGPIHCWNSTPISARCWTTSENSASPTTPSSYSQATMVRKKWSRGEATEDLGWVPTSPAWRARFGRPRLYAIPVVFRRGK
jgi:arylsulfatase A-like enzyme